jgi:hypothetical protein
MQSTRKKLQRISDELSAIAGVFDSRGFTEEQNQIDEAGTLLDRLIEGWEMMAEIDDEVAELGLNRKKPKHA